MNFIQVFTGFFQQTSLMQNDGIMTQIHFYGHWDSEVRARTDREEDRERERERERGG